MTRILTIIALLFATPAYSLSKEVCRDFEAQAAEMNEKARGGFKVDKYTELVLMKVNCGLSDITYSKRLLLPTSTMNSGWQSRLQRQHSLLHCNGGMSESLGITVRDNILEPDYQFAHQLVTRPSDCK